MKAWAHAGRVGFDKFLAALFGWQNVFRVKCYAVLIGLGVLVWWSGLWDLLLQYIFSRENIATTLVLGTLLVGWVIYRIGHGEGERSRAPRQPEWWE